MPEWPNGIGLGVFMSISKLKTKKPIGLVPTGVRILFSAFIFQFLTIKTKHLYSYYSNYITTMQTTTIQIKSQTLERLRFFKNYSKESYDELINNILDDVEEGELTDEAIDDIKIALREVKGGKGELIEDVANEFGVKL